jgi:hypothetical protein
LAVDLDVHRIEQRSRGTPGTKPSKIVLQRVHSAVHPPLEVIGPDAGRHF